MTKTLDVEELKATLPKVLDDLAPGDEVILTKNNIRVAKLVSENPRKPKQRPGPGLLKGKIRIVEEDEEHLRGFPGYPQ